MRISENERLRYYCGNVFEKRIHIDNVLLQQCVKDTATIAINEVSLLKLPWDGNCRGDAHAVHPRPSWVSTAAWYISEIEALTKGTNEYNVLCALGDIKRSFNCPAVITKTKLPNDKNMVLLKLGSDRHWGHVKHVRSLRTPYLSKMNKLCWVGGCSGLDMKSPSSRYSFIDKFYNKCNAIDCGFSRVDPGHIEYSYAEIGDMSREQQLNYKLLLSIEGNDKDSGLNWKLASCSVVLKCKATVVSWLMEDKLIPGVHYVLVKDDYSDLLEKIDWCLSNEDKCMEIIKNANAYMEQFLDEERETTLQKRVLYTYLDNVTIGSPTRQQKPAHFLDL